MKKITLLVTLLFAMVGYAQTFPEPYCGPLAFTFGVEPITLVNFAGIDNASDAATGGENDHEDFTDQTANVVAGTTYSITLKGNTDGGFTNRFIVFIDWNQDNDFDDAGEAYPIAATIMGSTGEDDISAVGSISVPTTALGGTTRMRVKKLYSTADYTNPCIGGGYGQVEDYSVAVTIPTCLGPSDLVAIVNTQTNATFTWSSTASNFEILIQPQGNGAPATANDTGINVAGLTYNATTLNPATAYEFYVRTECGTGSDFSTWSGPVLFNTIVAPGCVSTTYPADNAVDVPVGNITFTWDAPATGDPVDSYDLFAGDSPTTLALIGTYTENAADLVLNNYGAVVYWQLVPSNAGGENTGCPVFSFTTQNSPGYCLNAPSGQYPFNATVPTNCDGFTPNVITTAGYAGEYSLVTLTNTETYVFRSGTTDFITISDVDGTTPLAYGPSPLTWVSTIDGDVRFYSHIDDQCGTENVSRIRSVTCGVLSSDSPDYVSLQFPATLDVSQGGSGDVYGQVYEAGLTDVAPNVDGQAPGISAWVGISPVGQDTNPNTWTNFVVANWNPAFAGNNDEYFASIGSNLAPGTYYYATRFRLNTGGYVYGGINSTGDGNFWDGTTFVSGVLTVSPPPAPANDLCADAVALTPGQTFDQNPVDGTLFGATIDGPVPTCGSPNINVWYSVVVPPSGNITIETKPAAGSSLTDTVMAVYSGDCGSLVQIECDDDDGDGFFSLISLTGQQPGTLLISIHRYGSFGSAGNFIISAYDASLKTSSFDANGFTYYPNPVKDVLNLSYAKAIENISVYNLLGQQILSKTVNAKESPIDMSGFAAGAYMVKITSEGATKTLKVIKN